MAGEYSGTARITIFDLLWDWPENRHCVVGYTSMGHFGDTAVLGVIPVEGNEWEPGDLFDIAKRHRPEALYGQPPEHARASWLVMIGSGALVVPKRSTIIAPHAEWSVIGAQRVTLKENKAGHSHVVAGRMSLADKALEARARALLN